MKIIRTIGKRVALKACKQNKYTEAGLFLITNHENATEAEVIAVSNGYYNNKGNLIKQDVKVGDIVLINKAAGVKQVHDKEEIIFILGEEIQAKLSN